MNKNELKQLIKEVLAEQNALTTLQISTVGGGTTLLLYKGDAKGSEVSSDKHYKTPTQFKDLIASLNTTGGMTTDEVIKNILKKLTPAQLKELVREKIVVSDKVSEFLGEEASTKELQKLGFKPTESDVNEGSDAELVKWLEKRLGRNLHFDTEIPQRDRLRQLLAKLKKSNTNLNEVQGYVFGPMETPNNWISTNAKPKMKNGVKKYVVSAADFQKAFPNIQMKQLPTNPSKYSDYYVVDNEGDLIAYSQSNIGSGLD